MSALVQNLGLDAGKAQGIAASLVPQVLNSLISKTNDPGDSSFNLSGIASALTGGKTDGLDLNAMMTKFAGADGKIGLDDFTNLLGGKGNAESRNRFRSKKAEQQNCSAFLLAI